MVLPIKSSGKPLSWSDVSSLAVMAYSASMAAVGVTAAAVSAGETGQTE